MLPFVGYQGRDLGGGGVQVVAREPGLAGDAAVIDGSDGFPWPWTRSSRRSRVLSVSTVTDP